jgi:transposase
MHKASKLTSDYCEPLSEALSLLLSRLFGVVKSRFPATMRQNGQRLSATLQQSVMEHIAAGEKDADVVAATGVHRETIAKLRLNLEYWGQCYPPPTVRLGRPRLLRQAQLEALEAYLDGRPSAYLDEMQQFLYDDFDIDCSLPTVWRALQKLHFSRKLATKRAREQSEPL